MPYPAFAGSPAEPIEEGPRPLHESHLWARRGAWGSDPRGDQADGCGRGPQSRERLAASTGLARSVVFAHEQRAQADCGHYSTSLHGKNPRTVMGNAAWEVAGGSTSVSRDGLESHRVSGTSSLHSRVRSPVPEPMKWNVIDRLREQIQQRLDQLAGEADRLRKALAALDPRSSAAPAPKPAARRAPARTRPRSATAEPKPQSSATTTAPLRQRPSRPLIPVAGPHLAQPRPRCSPHSPAARR